MRLLARVSDDPFEPPRRFRTTFAGHVFRPIWDRLEIRPPTEHFHEFLIDILKRTMSVGWIRTELSKSEEMRHVLAKWLVEQSDLTKRLTPADHRPGELLSAPATGGVTALLLLARDLYLLQIEHQLPAELVRRLRDSNLFQGARYEVAIAAALMLGGFEIAWIREKTKSHCEFYATHKQTHERIAVETKSRHRAGTLNVPGRVDDAASGDVGRLFRSALQQAAPDAPFAVFVDVNLPFDGDLHRAVERWGRDTAGIVDIYGREEAAPAEFALATFTNHGWHYYPGENVPAGGFAYQYRPPFSMLPLRNPITQQAVVVGLDRYPRFPEDEPESPHYG